MRNKDAPAEPIILVVDDEKSTLLIIRKILQQEGYQVIEAEDGEEALAIFAAMLPHVVVMDIVMPVLDGLTACRRLKKLPGGDRTPVLIFTGVDDEKSVEEAFSAGAADFITKPLNWQELRHRIRRLLHLKEMEDTVAYQAHFDTLTDLPNRLLLHDRLTVALGQAQQEKNDLAVLLLNLRDFKMINDAFGFERGDLLLRDIAARLRAHSTENTTIARLGGNHFAFILPGLGGAEEAARCAEKLIDTISRSCQVDGQDVSISCNIGISLYPSDGQDAQTLLKTAETAMYRAARESLNSFLFYGREMNLKARERLSLETQMRRALADNQFTIHYQPLVEAESGLIKGAEALLRWQHPERGMISPAEFIPLAEETGLIVPMGAMVLRTVCSQGRAWQDEGLPSIRLSVNLSALQFQQQDLVQLINSILAETHLETIRLKVEITESIALRDLDYTIATLKELRRQGIKVSIDDFGTGYSSLNYIKRLPIDELKIDASFIRDAEHNPHDQVIVETILMLGRGLKLNVVAEGVETTGQLELLQRAKCNEIQGYYFSRPLPADHFQVLLQQGKINP